MFLLFHFCQKHVQSLSKFPVDIGDLVNEYVGIQEMAKTETKRREKDNIDIIRKSWNYFCSCFIKSMLHSGSITSLKPKLNVNVLTYESRLSSTDITKLGV